MEVFPEYLGAMTDLDYSLLMVMYIFAMQTEIISEYNTATVFGDSLEG